MAASGIARGIKGFFGRFPSVFWIVQIFELMERGAYYSMMPILAVHFIFNVGLPTWFGLILTIFMYPFQYGMPILSSAFGEKLGYKKQMTIGLVILFDWKPDGKRLHWRRRLLLHCRDDDRRIDATG